MHKLADFVEWEGKIKLSYDRYYEAWTMLCWRDGSRKWVTIKLRKRFQFESVMAWHRAFWPMKNISNIIWLGKKMVGNGYSSVNGKEIVGVDPNHFMQN